VSQQLSHIVSRSSFTNISNQTVAINPADITGPIVLRMTVDDSANTATGSFSLTAARRSRPVLADADFQRPQHVRNPPRRRRGRWSDARLTPTPTPPPTPDGRSKLIR
jgi:hypothetical protein